MRGLCKRAALALAIWASVAVPAMAQTTLRMVSHADIKILDPIWTTALITRNFGYMVYDTLFATDADLKVQPQMAEKYTVSNDKMTWTITLRDGLVWSDGTPVTMVDKEIETEMRRMAHAAAIAPAKIGAMDTMLS